MAELKIELSTRWTEIFEALVAGEDVPPTSRLRTEGMMEAAVLTGQATSDELSQAMSACYLAVFGRTISKDFGDNWREFYPFPQIPAVGQRAPVYPSTRDSV